MSDETPVRINIADSSGDQSPIERRSFLSNMWKAGAVMVGAAGLWTSWDLIKPLPSAGFGGLVRAVPPEAVPEVGVVEVPVARSYLTRINGEIIAINEKCTHLGCKVPFCATSGQFECPCHGSIFNRAGEFLAGPSPRGLDRFPIEVADSGLIYIDTGTTIDGAAPGVTTIDEPPTGPSCATEGGH
ncbi:MAG: ubiquinol-cytochrome c reductase iron-sulfur subunit [Acidimicrobiales bacterium]